MTQTTTINSSLEILTPVADYFKVLSEVSRLMVLDLLRKSGPLNVSEISEATGLGQANLSKHLKLLTQAGFLSRQPSGVSVYYKIADPSICELCELVCDRLKGRLVQQARQFNEYEAFK